MSSIPASQKIVFLLWISTMHHTLPPLLEPEPSGLSGAFRGVQEQSLEASKTSRTLSSAFCLSAANRGQDPPREPPRKRLKCGGDVVRLGTSRLGYSHQGKINVHCIALAHWSGCASRCTGGAWTGYVHSPYSSHCLTVRCKG